MTARVAWQVSKKEFRQILRERRTLALILLMPIVLTILFGKATGAGRIHDIPLVILDEDGSPESQAIVASLKASEDVQLVGSITTVDDAQALLERGEIKAALVIPAGFAREVQDGKEATLRLLLDGTDNISAPIVEGATNLAILQYNKDHAIHTLGKQGLRPEQGRRLIQRVSVASEIRFNPGLQYLRFLMPAIIGLTLQLVTVMLMAVSIPRERERGTLDQLIASPITRAELILGKLLPYFVIGLFNIATVLCVVDRGFGIRVGKQMPLLLGLCALFVLTSLATGLLISSISHSQFQAVEIAVFYVMPVFMLSGAYAPLEVIPPYVRPVSYLFPLMYFLRAARAVTVRGAGLVMIWKDLVILGGFIIVYLYWAVYSFQKRSA